MDEHVKAREAVNEDDRQSLEAEDLDEVSGGMNTPKNGITITGGFMP